MVTAHQADMYRKSGKNKEGAALKGCVKLDSPFYGIAARKLKKNRFF
jgi:hypothetical protein